MIRSLCLFLLFAAITNTHAQVHFQYFDGADTLPTSVIVTLVPDTANVWQIGRPHKTLFDSAATFPNAIVTDTVAPIPTSNSSSFIVSIHPYTVGPFIRAYQWKQKLDLQKKINGGIVEFSTDSGAHWENAFNNPHVYSYYGFLPYSQDTLLSGEYALSGTDTVWRDIWLCLPTHIVLSTDSMLVRFTLKTDTLFTNKEGWMIDNIMVHPTFMHTASKLIKETDAINVFPTVTKGIVQIGAKRTYKLTGIRKMQLINAAGKVVCEYGSSAVNTSIDISRFPAGEYYLKVTTNLNSNSFKIILQ
jgi:hypothetical protein